VEAHVAGVETNDSISSSGDDDDPGGGFGSLCFGGCERANGSDES
jgi:hypothetical protein